MTKIQTIVAAGKVLCVDCDKYYFPLYDHICKKGAEPKGIGKIIDVVAEWCNACQAITCIEVVDGAGGYCELCGTLSWKHYGIKK